VSDARARPEAPAASGEIEPLRLGPLEVWPPVVLAPMAGITNPPFRALCREYGAGLCISEMITARGWLHGNRLTRLLAAPGQGERPRSVQVYGTDPADVGEMVRQLVDEGVDHVDLNLGCPVPKVTSKGGGAAIPLKPRLMARLLRAMVGAAGSVPVTIKVRTGIDARLLTYLDAGRVAQEEGAAAIGLHARTAAQLYSGEADWDAIGRLVESVDVPVLGNGDVWEARDALRMMRQSGCAGVIVGRGCLGRPWLFRELVRVFDGREPEPPPRMGEVAEIAAEHARRLIELFGPENGMRQMRKWLGWYTKGFRGSAALRGRLHAIEDLPGMSRALGQLDPTEEFPAAALRARRAKGGRTQRVKLPEGYLDQREDDAAPPEPETPEEIEAIERALDGG